MSPCSRPRPPRPQLLCPPGLLSPTEQVHLLSTGLPPFDHGECRYSAEEYARKFGSAPAEENLTNDIDDAKPLAKEEGSLLSTVVEIAMKFAPLIIDTLAGSTGPSQTDR